MNVTWSIDSIKCKALDNGNANVVSEVHWRVSAEDGEFFTSVYGSAGIPFEGTKFTAYEKLTKDQVLGWLFAQIDKDEIEANLASQIDALKNPAVVTNPLPWVETNEV